MDEVHTIVVDDGRVLRGVVVGPRELDEADERVELVLRIRELPILPTTMPVELTLHSNTVVLSTGLLWVSFYSNKRLQSPRTD